jgi:hypothetical protein
MMQMLWTAFTAVFPVFLEAWCVCAHEAINVNR